VCDLGGLPLPEAVGVRGSDDPFGRQRCGVDNNECTKGRLGESGVDSKLCRASVAFKLRFR
jgi:hypothetical protein